MRLSPALAVTAWRLCLAPMPPGWMKVMCMCVAASTVKPAANGSIHNRSWAIRPFLASWLQLEGGSIYISAACSSSARTDVSGRRLIDAGLVDIAIVGGLNTLSRMPVNGLTASNHFPLLCKPFGRDRQGYHRW